MSLAILKKKTKATSPYFSKEHCFVLNMTGRGGGIKTKLKKNACAKVEYMDTKSCNDKWKLHKPAPQMGYGVYINKKAKGSHRPSGYECKNPADCVTTSKPVWKLTSTYDSSLVIEKNKLKALNCNKYDTPLDSISGKPTSVAKPCPAGVKQNKRDHTSINKKWCNNVTKNLGGRRSASEQIARHKGKVLTHTCLPNVNDERILSFDIDDGIITFIKQRSSCAKPLIIRGFPYKILVQVSGSTKIKIYTNMSNNPLKMCDVFYDNDEQNNNFQIKKLKVSDSFCSNMNPILYFETSKNRITINISKSYKGYALTPVQSKPKQCH